MATLLLSAAGAAIGGSFGGSIAGLTTMALGKAVGATLGSVIDQKILGAGSAPVETGRVDRFRVMGSSEGAALSRVFGRVRVAGQIIWSSRFLESVDDRRVGGKGGGGGQKVREFSYSVSLAVALCEGEIIRVGRIWADGQVLDQSGVTWRLHVGSEAQSPDPLIAALEGEANAPAYRGTAYAVFENLDLTPYGNRIPQFNFEVFRRPAPSSPDLAPAPALSIQGVALVPGTGEYSLATSPVYLRRGRGETNVVNVHNDLGQPDLLVSTAQLMAECPNARSVSLVVSWFGDDLRCGRCRLQPAVEQGEQDGDRMPWRVSGQLREQARVVSRIEGRPLFGGTPADAAVIEGIRHLRDIGQSVMFYPFILMDILPGNRREDPWTGSADQPPVPWRGRITLSRAPGNAGSPDKTAAAAEEVDAFFGSAAPGDFTAGSGTVEYTGLPEWSYRRFILHYARLCALAGGVDAFCIGSEMRGLTQVRDGAASYPTVRALRQLAVDVRSILGPDTKIGYAADWSEYFGHQPGDGSGDVFFHLDPLWSHPDIDFVGIDNYMPLSDWRDGPEHEDSSAGSIYDLDYLKGNVAGGEGFDWFYADADGREVQDRRPIRDTAHGENWVFRYKDLIGWWSSRHHDRPGGVRSTAGTDWQPRSKPIWFTELGCPAVDKGTNQPNVFFDPKSSESFFPYFSNGSRDDFIQYRYLQATFAHWSDPANNPVSDVYGGRMVDLARAHVWAWDARPWPDFPDRIETWTDGPNYERGHWLNGRMSLAGLAEITAEVCKRSDVTAVDVRALYGGVTGYLVESVETARQSLQPLMLAFGFDSFGREDRLAFATRGGRLSATLLSERFVRIGEEPELALTRAPASETAGRIVLGFVRSDLDYQSGAVESVAPDEAEPHTAQSSLPIVLSEGEARAVCDRWLSEGRIARDGVEFVLPLSQLSISTGDVVALQVNQQSDLYRIDRIDEAGHRKASAIRLEAAVYSAPVPVTRRSRSASVSGPSRADAEFLDLPLLSGDESPHAPHVAVARYPWAGAVAVYSASADFGYRLNRQVLRPAVIGETLEAFPSAIAGLWMPASLRVQVNAGAVLQSVTREDILNGANAAAIRSGHRDWEVLQFEVAELTGPREYRLSTFLRGQAGTDGVVTGSWPSGSDFILLDAAVVQLDLPASARGLERYYRIGPAIRPYDDPSYQLVVRAFSGVGLRPYRPVHLRAVRLSDGSIEVTWTRRTRIDGDSWQGTDVPLGEERELYHVRVLRGAASVRDFSPSSARAVYSLAEQTADGPGGPLSFEVAQVSERYGPGPYERIDFDG